MKQSSIVFLQAVLIVLGLGMLALLLWEPHVEGVNAHVPFFAVYLDPFIALVYGGSIAFFVALYKAFKLLGYAGQNRIFSHAAVQAVRSIKYCALTIVGFVIAEEAFIIVNHGNDDAAGGIAMGIFIAVGSIIIATTAAVFEKILQNATEIQSENELTV